MTFQIYISINNVVSKSEENNVDRDRHILVLLLIVSSRKTKNIYLELA